MSSAYSSGICSSARRCYSNAVELQPFLTARLLFGIFRQKLRSLLEQHALFRSFLYRLLITSLASLAFHGSPKLIEEISNVISDLLDALRVLLDALGALNASHHFGIVDLVQRGLKTLF